MHRFALSDRRLVFVGYRLTYERGRLHYNFWITLSSVVRGNKYSDHFRSAKACLTSIAHTWKYVGLVFWIEYKTSRGFTRSILGSCGWSIIRSIYPFQNEDSDDEFDKICVFDLLGCKLYKRWLAVSWIDRSLNGTNMLSIRPEFRILRSPDYITPSDWSLALPRQTDPNLIDYTKIQL